MSKERARHPILTAFGVLPLVGVGLLLVCDALPHLFPAGAHDLLAALPLVLIAVGYVVYQAVRRAPTMEWVRTAIVALAFLFWGANLLCRDRRLATVFNDIAIAGFVLDVFLVIIAPTNRNSVPGPRRT